MSTLPTTNLKKLLGYYIKATTYQSFAPKESRQDIFVKAFKKTISELEEQLGNDPKKWEWQKVHQITHKHTFGQEGGLLGWYFNVGAIPINGGH